MIGALFVETNGIYFNDLRIDPWDIRRDAMNYSGPHPVIAHPPCKRWGRFWGGGPMLHGTEKQLKLGDDNGMFAKSLWAVRTFGGVIEHPEASHAWKYYGLNKPPRSGGWFKADEYGGYTCCVAQGHYGHKSQKYTWLYVVNTLRPELKWGPVNNKVYLCESSIHSKEQAKKLRSSMDYKPAKRISTLERLATPEPFKELLISFFKETESHE